MSTHDLKMTYIGGPTALLEWGGLRLLTDPTFDPPGEEYQPGARLRKIAGPAMSSASLGHIDVVLLSHDHHFDNLDHAGRTLLKNADRVLTTTAGAERLGSHATGLAPWQSLDVPCPEGRILHITATPARHGPAHMDRGPVVGFVLSLHDAPESAIYVSGDTVWYEGVAEVGERFPIGVAILFMGAARVPEVGPWNLTFTAKEGIQAAQAFPQATIVPLHFEGWRHFSESREDIARVFKEAGLDSRLRWLDPGEETILLRDAPSRLRPAM